jgi:hypothetical protein
MFCSNILSASGRLTSGMLVALAATALIGPQLGWRAGTPTPILEGNPGWVELYWKAWENLQAATVEEKEPGPWPPRAFAPEGSISFEQTLTISTYANWGWRAHPVRETLAYVMQGIADEGTAPARFGTAGSSGEATGLPLAAFAAERVFRISGDRVALQKHAGGAQKRHAFYRVRYSFPIPPKDEKEKPRVGYRVPAELSSLPFPQEAPGDVSAEAIGLLLQDAAMMAKLYRGLGDSRSAGTSERLADAFAAQLNALWSAEDRRFRSTAEGAAERDSLMPLLGAIGGRAPHAREALQGLFDPSRYYRRTLFPTVARTDRSYSGSMGTRPLHSYLALRALIDSGMQRDAGRAAEHMLAVYESAAGPGLGLFGAYGPETRTPPEGAAAASLEAGTIAISALIEAVMGIDVDAKAGKVTWFLRRSDRHGLENLRFGDNVVSIIWTNGTFEAQCEKPFTLELSRDRQEFEHRFPAGKSVWTPGAE